jgi:MFS family permease
MKAKDIFSEFITKPSLIFTYFGMAAIVFVTTALIVWLPTYFEKDLGIEPKTAGSLAGAVMVMAIVGAPLGGFLIDRWRKTQANARLLFPALSTLVSAVILFVSLTLLKGSGQVVLLFIFGIIIMTFISGAAAVTQDVIHPGLRAMSYAIAVAVQNLLGSFTAPIILGKISDLSNIKTAMSILPFVLLIGALLFYIGSRFYLKDLSKVPLVQLVAAN